MKPARTGIAGVVLAGAVALLAAGCQSANPALPTLPAATVSATAGPAAPMTSSASGSRAGPATGESQRQNGSSSASPASGPPDAGRITAVLAISVDGLNPSAITRLGPKGTPNFHRLLQDGAGTLNARTEYEMTRTLPNHTGMLTGRRVTASRGGHGVTFNVDNGKTVHAAAGEYVASVFDVVHDRGGSTVLYSAKEKFAFYARTWNAAGAPDRVGADDGRRKIDTVVLDTDNTRLVGKLDARLAADPPTFSFLHISLPDVAGHAHGFMGKDYLKAVRQTDTLLGTVLATIDSRPELSGHLMVILTADHGGLGPGHSDPTVIADYRIPFIVWGPGVEKGADLYRLDPAFADPGNTRPGYVGGQPIRNGDVANLATDVLGFPVVPGSQFDRAQDLDPFG